MIICEICKKEFEYINNLSKHINIHNITKQKYYDKYLKKENEGICKECGRLTKFENLGFGYRNFCGIKCSSRNIETLDKKQQTKKKEKTIIKKEIECKICNLKTVSLKALSQHIISHNITSKSYYDQYLKKENDGICKECKKETKFLSIRKGYQTFCNLKCSNINKDTKNKIKKQWNKTKVKQANKKREETNLKKYGVTICSKNKKVKRKNKETFLKNRIPKIIDLLKHLDIDIINLNTYSNMNSLLTFKCNKCNNLFTSTFFNLIQRMHKCNCTFEASRSSGEKELEDFLKEIMPNEEIICNSKLEGKEFDFLITSKKIAIEYDGLYWHSEKIHKNKEYHLNKTKLCNKYNYQLIHIFSDEWDFKKEIVKSRLKVILNTIKDFNKVYARNCIIKEIDFDSKKKFLDKYHLQGNDISRINIGAFYNNDLISVMTFSYGNISKGSRKKDYVFELSRFCVKPLFIIPGIASKLLTYFKRNYRWKNIFTYSDLRWSNGNLYYKLNFKSNGNTGPNYWYTKNGITRIHRFALRKTKFEDKKTPEWLLRYNEGYLRVWDCGSLKFILENKEDL